MFSLRKSFRFATSTWNSLILSQLLKTSFDFEPYLIWKYEDQFWGPHTASFPWVRSENEMRCWTVRIVDREKFCGRFAEIKVIPQRKNLLLEIRAHQSSQVAQYMLLLSLLLLTLLSLFYHCCYCDYYIFNLEYSVSGYLLGHELISIYWKTDSRTFGTERDRIWLYCNNVIIASMVN